MLLCLDGIYLVYVLLLLCHQFSKKVSIDQRLLPLQQTTFLFWPVLTFMSYMHRFIRTRKWSTIKQLQYSNRFLHINYFRVLYIYISYAFLYLFKIFILFYNKPELKICFYFYNSNLFLIYLFLVSSYSFQNVTLLPITWTLFCFWCFFGNKYSYSDLVFCIEVKILLC
jgi:hypothetical protein